MDQPFRRYYFFLVAGVFLWCVMIFFPPMESMFGHPSASFSSLVYRAFSPVCHQYDSRSFHIDGVKFAVCSRCTAVYCSFLLGVILWPLRPDRRLSKPAFLWIAALAVILADVLADAVHLHASTLLTRSLTGGAFGLIAGMLITPLFLQGCSDLLTHFKHHRGISYESKT